MKSLTLSFCLLLAALFSSPAMGLHVFYQPQNADAAVTPEQWRDIWRSAREQGFETVVVQWTRHADSDFDGETGWLRTSLSLAEESGLQLILGLHFDTNYYPVLERGDSTTYFWHHLLSQSRQQQARLLRTWHLSPVGWYLPYELDDTLMRSDSLLRELSHQLSSFARLDDLPLHISAFASGQLSPRVYASWLGMISAAGVQVWWQDGRGTATHPEVVRQAYEDALSCDVGIIHEAFLQQESGDAAFVAEPDRDFRIPVQVDDCHQRGVFSLRYLPFASAHLGAVTASDLSPSHHP